MLTEKNKITIRQTFIIFIVSTLSAAIRLFPSESARIGKEACWISPLLSAAALFLLCLMLQTIFKNNSITDLGDVFYLSLGKIPGKFLLLFYLFWTLILYFLYIRYYAERLLSSIYPNTDMRFFIFSMMIVVYIAIRGKIEAFARFSEFSILIFILVFIVFFLFLLPNVKVENLYPITYHDFIPAAKAAYPILGIWGYITLLFFFGGNIINKDQIKKTCKKSILFVTAMTSLMIAFVVGSLGYRVAQRMPLPFFNAVKLITFMETLDRMEAILISVWVISDFIVITLFALIVMYIIKSLFAVSEIKYFSSPMVLLGYFGSQYLTSNRFEFETYSSTVGLTSNIAICYVIPAIVFLIGKLRKKI